MYKFDHRSHLVDQANGETTWVSAPPQQADPTSGTRLQYNNASHLNRQLSQALGSPWSVPVMTCLLSDTMTHINYPPQRTQCTSFVICCSGLSSTIYFFVSCIIIVMEMTGIFKCITILMAQLQILLLFQK